MNSIKPDSEPRSTGKAQTQMDAPRPNLEAASNQEVSVRIATSAQAVEQLRAVWQGWTRGLYTDIDYFLQALRVDETILRPYVISVWRGDAPLAILAGQVKSRQAFSIVSMVRIKGPRARVLEVSTKARLGPPSPEADEIFISQLCKALREGGADLVSFQRLSLESQLFHRLGGVARIDAYESPARVFLLHTFSDLRCRQTSSCFLGKNYARGAQKDGQSGARLPRPSPLTMFLQHPGIR